MKTHERDGGAVEDFIRERAVSVDGRVSGGRRRGYAGEVVGFRDVTK